MAKLIGFASLNTGTAVSSKYVAVDFRENRGQGKGFLIKAVYASLELYSGITATTNGVINVAVGKGSATGGANRYPGVDANNIVKMKFRTSESSDLERTVILVEPVLVDEDSCYLSASIESATGSVTVNFILYGDVVEPTELERAILAFQV